jgi:aryl sulfotransferase
MRRRMMMMMLMTMLMLMMMQVRYIFVARNGKDLGISLHNYLANFKEDVIGRINALHAAHRRDSIPLAIPPEVNDFFDLWVPTGGYGCCDLLGIVKSWWQLRGSPNVLLLHYQDMKQDLPAVIARVAAFIGVDPASLDMDKVRGEFRNLAVSGCLCCPS